MCPNNSQHLLRKLRRPKNGKIVELPGMIREDTLEVEEEPEIYSEEEEVDTIILDIPIHKFNDTSTGFSAPISKEKYKQIDRDGVVYRIPSHGVKLDFIQAVYEMNEEMYPDTRNSDILLSLDEIAVSEKKSLEVAKPLPLSHEVSSVSKSELELLLEKALGLFSASNEESALPKGNGHKKSPTPSANTQDPTSSIIKAEDSNGRKFIIQDDANGPKQDLDDEGIRPEERADLLAIQDLMIQKGKAALWEFLLAK